MVLIKCPSCNGAGKYQGMGMIWHNCIECGGSKVKEIFDEIIEVSSSAINISLEKAKEILSDSPVKKRGRPKKNVQ